MKIRIYNSGDSIKVKKLYCEFVKYHEILDSNFKKVDNHGDIFLESIEKNHKNPDYRCCVAELDGEIKGYCVAKILENSPIYPESRYGYIANIYVAKDQKHRGIGDKLLQKIEDWLKKQGVSRVELAVAIKNAIGKSFWEKHEYTPFVEQLYKNI